VNLPAGSPSVPFAVTGQHSGTVIITATLPPALGGLAATAVITFHDAAITGLSATNNSLPAGLALTSTARLTATVSAGTNISYSWNFGDATPVAPFTVTNWITHNYSSLAGGLYTATVTARNAATTITATTVVTINNPAPTITQIGPITPAVGANQTIQITGTQFVPSPTVRLQRGATITNYVASFTSATRLSFNVPGSDIGVAGSYTLFVINPAPPVAEPPRRSPGFPFNVQ
jgi:hypothetical protein